jgi:hypothetical protein
MRNRTAGYDAACYGPVLILPRPIDFSVFPFPLPAAGTVHESSFCQIPRITEGCYPVPVCSNNLDMGRRSVYLLSQYVPDKEQPTLPGRPLYP